MNHRLKQLGPNYFVIERIADGLIAFSGSEEQMKEVFNRLQLNSKAVAIQVENHMRLSKNGKPWEKYQRWLKERESVEKVDNLSNLEEKEES